jgi:hypothetical protein
MKNGISDFGNSKLVSVGLTQKAHSYTSNLESFSNNGYFEIQFHVHTEYENQGIESSYHMFSVWR